MGKYLDKIINEAIDKMLITEITSSRCYHFCTWQALIAILSNNQFALRTNVTSKSEHWNQPNRRFYMSLSRVADGRVGYQSYFSNEDILCRIELDGDKLSDNYRIRPVNWGENGNFDTKEKRDKGLKDGRVTSKERYTRPSKSGYIPFFAKVQDEVENEDRVFSNKPIIPNAYSYIRRIDIYIKNTSEYQRAYMTNDEMLKNRDEYLSELIGNIDVKWVDKIHFYDNMNAFNSRRHELPFPKPTENTTKYKKILSRNERMNNDTWMEMYITTLAQGIGCIGQLKDVIEKNDFNLVEYYARPWLEKYKLSDMVDKVPDVIHFITHLSHAKIREPYKTEYTITEADNIFSLIRNDFYMLLETMENAVRTINKSAPNNIYTMRTLKMITDFVKSTGCDTIATTTQKSYGKSIYQTLINKLEEKLLPKQNNNNKSIYSGTF